MFRRGAAAFSLPSPVRPLFQRWRAPLLHVMENPTKFERTNDGTVQGKGRAHLRTNRLGRVYCVSSHWSLPPRLQLQTPCAGAAPAPTRCSCGSQLGCVNEVDALLNEGVQLLVGHPFLYNSWMLTNLSQRSFANRSKDPKVRL